MHDLHASGQWTSALCKMLLAIVQTCMQHQPVIYIHRLIASAWQLIIQDAMRYVDSEFRCVPSPYSSKVHHSLTDVHEEHVTVVQVELNCMGLVLAHDKTFTEGIGTNLFNS